MLFCTFLSDSVATQLRWHGRFYSRYMRMYWWKIVKINRKQIYCSNNNKKNQI